MSKLVNKGKVIKKLLQLGVPYAEIAELMDVSLGYVYSVKSKNKYEVMSAKDAEIQNAYAEAHMENISRAIDKINSPSLSARLKYLIYGR